jgi:hypothetical protein
MVFRSLRIFACIALAVCATAIAAGPELSVRDFTIHATVDGMIARTTMRWELTNPRNDEDPVEVHIASPNAIACDMALWIGDQRREAVVVAREAAEEAFSTIVSESRDPALLIDEGKGKFTLSVFPVPRDKTRHVEVTFVHPLKPSGDGTTWTYSTPTAWYVNVQSQIVHRFEAALSLRMQGSIAALATPEHEFERNEKDGRTHLLMQRNQEAVPEEFKVAITPARPLAPMVAKTPDGKGRLFATVLPIPPGSRPDPTDEVVLILDGALSAGELKRIRNFARLLLEAFPPNTPCRVILAGPSPTRLDNNFGPAITALESLPSEGKLATEAADLLGAIRMGLADRKEGHTRHLVLCSQGWDAVSPTRRQAKGFYESIEAPLLRDDVRLHTVGIGTCNPRIPDLSLASGGHSVYLGAFPSNDPEEAKQLAMGVLRVGPVKNLRGLQVTPKTRDLNVNGVGRSDLDAKHILLTGQTDSSGELSLNFEGQTAEVLRISLGEPNAPVELIAPLQAGLHARQLWATVRTGKQDIDTAMVLVKTCLDNNVLVCPMSMLVLERREDYMRFGIPLPRDLQGEIASENVSEPGNDANLFAQVQQMETEQMWRDAARSWRYLATQGEGPNARLRAEACSILATVHNAYIRTETPAALLAEALEGLLASSGYLEATIQRISEGSISARDRQVRKHLQKSIPRIHFTEVSLADTLQFLREASGINLQCEWTALQIVGVEKSTPVAMDLRDAAIDDILDAICRLYDPEDDDYDQPTWYIKDGRVILTTRQRANATLLTRTYHVGDLLQYAVETQNVEEVHEGDSSSLFGGDGLLDSSGGGMRWGDVTPGSGKPAAVPTSRQTAPANGSVIYDVQDLIVKVPPAPRLLRGGGRAY